MSEAGDPQPQDHNRSSLGHCWISLPQIQRRMSQGLGFHTSTKGSIGGLSFCLYFFICKMAIICHGISVRQNEVKIERVLYSSLRRVGLSPFPYRTVYMRTYEVVCSLLFVTLNLLAGSGRDLNPGLARMPRTCCAGELRPFHAAWPWAAMSLLRPLLSFRWKTLLPNEQGFPLPPPFGECFLQKEKPNR